MRSFVNLLLQESRSDAVSLTTSAKRIGHCAVRYLLKSLCFLLCFALVGLQLKVWAQLSAIGDVEHIQLNLDGEIGNDDYLSVGNTNFGSLTIYGGYNFPKDATNIPSSAAPWYAQWANSGSINIGSVESRVTVYNPGSLLSVGVNMEGGTNDLVIASGSDMKGDLEIDGPYDTADVGGTVDFTNIVPDPGCYLNGVVTLTASPGYFTAKRGAQITTPQFHT
jgi:hypothetical protein